MSLRNKQQPNEKDHSPDEIQSNSILKFNCWAKISGLWRRPEKIVLFKKQTKKNHISVIITKNLTTTSSSLVVNQMDVGLKEFELCLNEVKWTQCYFCIFMWRPVMFVYFTHCCDLLTFFWEKFNIYFGCRPIPSIQHFEGFIVLCQFPMADYSYLLEKAVWNGSLFLPTRGGSFRWLTIHTCSRRQSEMADYSYLH